MKNPQSKPLPELRFFPKTETSLILAPSTIFRPFYDILLVGGIGRIWDGSFK